MMRALWSAASGMKTQQDNMDVVAHNLANVNTYGAKKVRAEFHDLLYQTLRPAGGNSGPDSQYPTGLQIGLGDRLAATQRIFTQGNLQATGNPARSSLIPTAALLRRTDILRLTISQSTRTRRMIPSLFPEQVLFRTL